MRSQNRHNLVLPFAIDNLNFETSPIGQIVISPNVPTVLGLSSRLPLLSLMLVSVSMAVSMSMSVLVFMFIYFLFSHTYVHKIHSQYHFFMIHVLIYKLIFDTLIIIVRLRINDRCQWYNSIRDDECGEGCEKKRS